MARLASGRKVPLRREPGARDGVDDEEVLAEDEGWLEFRESADERGRGDRGRCEFPGVERDGAESVECLGGETRNVDELGESSYVAISFSLVHVRK